MLPEPGRVLRTAAGRRIQIHSASPFDAAWNLRVFPLSSRVGGCQDPGSVELLFSQIRPADLLVDQPELVIGRGRARSKFNSAAQGRDSPLIFPELRKDLSLEVENIGIGR